MVGYVAFVEAHAEANTDLQTEDRRIINQSRNDLSGKDKRIIDMYKDDRVRKKKMRRTVEKVPPGVPAFVYLWNKNISRASYLRRVRGPATPKIVGA